MRYSRITDGPDEQQRRLRRWIAVAALESKSRRQSRLSIKLPDVPHGPRSIRKPLRRLQPVDDALYQRI